MRRLTSIRFTMHYVLQVTISDQGVVGLHKWLPNDSQIINKFDFTRDFEVDTDLAS